jgi:superfamily II DNA/RNA helicase
VPVSDPGAKRLALRKLIEQSGLNTGLVFCNRKSEVDIVAKSLKKHGFDAAAIHGDLDQSQRTKTLEGFRRGELKLLVASDVAARGLDLPDVSHVFNYDVPHHADDYVHRIGRTGRAGRSGDSITLVTPADGRNLDKVIRLIGKTPEELKLDVDWSEVKSDGRRETRRRPERRDRERSYGRPASETSVAPMEPAKPTPRPAGAEPAPVAAVSESAEEPRRSRRPRREPREHREDRPRQEARSEPTREPTREPREERPRQEARPEPHRESQHESHREPRREHRDERPRQDTRPQPQREPRRSPDRGRGDDDRRVVGFGNDVPAFLSRK